MTNEQSFVTPTLPHYHIHRQRHHPPICSWTKPQHATAQDPTRRRLLLLSLLSLLPPHPCTAATLSDMVAPIVMCRKIMTPVSRYIEEGSWDKGRTNVNYCTRVLALRRNMRESASQLQGDKFYDAMGIMGELDNTMTQLDASLYTPLFIPAEEGISPEQRKYQIQARDFYAQAIDLLEGYIRLIPDQILNDARSKASKAVYEIRFEDE